MEKVNDLTDREKKLVAMLKAVRTRMAGLPCGHAEAIWIQGLAVELCDILLFGMGDTEVIDELNRQANRVRNQLPANVQFIAAPAARIDGPSVLPPVLITGQNEGIPGESPQILNKPSVDVLIDDSRKTMMVDNASRVTEKVPATGVVRFVKPGADPVQAMDDDTLTVPVNGSRPAIG